MANGATRIITIDDVTPQPITASIVGRRITIQEDNSVVGWPTTAFLIRKPTAVSQAIQFGAGLDFTFRNDGYYYPGDVVGYVQAVVAGSTTFSIDEEGVK